MKYIIVVLRSRNEIYSFAGILCSYGVNATIIETPRQVEVSCGLSVRCSVDAINTCREIISRRGFSTLVGFFEIQELGNGNRSVRRL